MAKLIKLPTFNDSRGSLTVLEREAGFTAKRIYYVYGVNNQDIVRGGHRHHKTKQALISINGACTIFVNNGTERKEYLLNSPEKCLILPETDWHTMYGFSADCVLLVLASEYYDINDYIDEPYES